MTCNNSYYAVHMINKSLGTMPSACTDKRMDMNIEIHCFYLLDLVYDIVGLLPVLLARMSVRG